MKDYDFHYLLSHFLFPFGSQCPGPGLLLCCGPALSPSISFGNSSHPYRIAAWCCFGVFFPRLSKRTRVSLRKMANISPFLTSVKTSKSTFMTFHTAFFYVPLKGHGILMSLASIIFICHVLLSWYNKLTKKGDYVTSDINSCEVEGEGKRIRLVPTEGLKTLFEGSSYTSLPGGHGPEPLSRVFPQFHHRGGWVAW